MYKVIFKRFRNIVNVLLGKAIVITKKEQGNVYSFHCPICKKKDIYFKPIPFSLIRQLDKHQYIHSIFQKETFNIEYFHCSYCHCIDRERLYALYIDLFMSKQDINKKFRLLDIAPAGGLSLFLKNFPNITVRTADLYMEAVDDKVDITNMNIYADESFDIFICSHVLEHVEKDMTAIKELYRILSKNGWGIAMVPIDLGLQEDYENPVIIDEAGRWKHFGQNDHVRMYSKGGFVSKLESAGFTVHQYGIDFFGPEVFAKNGIHPRSVLYIVTK